MPPNFLNPLYHALTSVLDSLRQREFGFAKLKLQTLSEFVEKNLQKKLNFKDAVDPSNSKKAGHVAGMIWDLMTE